MSVTPKNTFISPGVHTREWDVNTSEGTIPNLWPKDLFHKEMMGSHTFSAALDCREHFDAKNMGDGTIVFTPRKMNTKWDIKHVGTPVGDPPRFFTGSSNQS